MPRKMWCWLLAIGLAGLVAGCRAREGGEVAAGGEGVSPSARMEIVEALRQDSEMLRGEADGGGTVQFSGDPGEAIAGQPGRWEFVYRAGPLGIEVGGWVFFQAPPFWGWSTPQVIAPEAPGFSEVGTPVSGVELEAITVDQQLLGIRIGGRPLAEGEEIRLVYGAGPVGAVADRYAESRSCFFFAVDGDGDGVRGLLQDNLCVRIAPGPAAGLVLSLPSRVEPESVADLIVAAVDVVGNAVSDWQGTVMLQGPAELGLPGTLEIAVEDRGTKRVEIAIPETGLFTIAASTRDGLQGESNPMRIGHGDRILWADLHGHSSLSDGTGTPEEYLRYARDVAGLDVVALTDHDHWGMQPLAVHPELWQEIRDQTEGFHRPGHFVTLLGYEWTSWIHGHRHVLYFSDEGRVLSSVDPEYQSPLQLWAALRGTDALTFAHHSAGGPIATNWQIPPDPELEPVTEIVSVHGSSESPDSPAPIYSAVEGNFVRDVLDRGFVFGFIGSGDGHDGHPGMAHLNGVSGGLAAILSRERTREGVREALKRRRVYATNGPRILLDLDLAGFKMGEMFDLDEIEGVGATDRALLVTTAGTAAIRQVEMVRSGRVVESSPCPEAEECSVRFPLLDLERGEYLYVRVLQVDGGAAWSSPLYVR